MQGPKHNSTTSPDGAALPSPPSSQLLHDLKQPLSAINNYAQAGIQLIDNTMAEPARLRELFAKIAAQSTRANALSQDLGKALARDSGQS